MKHQTEHFFSLIELLVAVAVLVILMGFLFQFTGSAQKLWSSNTARTEMSSQAEVVFDVLQKDLEKMYVVTADEDIDAQAGWMLDTNDLCFFIEENGVISQVRYHLQSKIIQLPSPSGLVAKHVDKLYRFVQGSSSSTGNTAKNFGEHFGGNDAKNYVNVDLTSSPKSPAQPEDYLLAENIAALSFTTDVDTKDSSGNIAYIRDMPCWIRLEMTFKIPQRFKNGEKSDENSDRTFSKFFILRH